MRRGDPHEAARHHVQEEAPEEFVGLQRHDLHAVVVRVVPPPEPDATVGVIDQSIIRERHAVRVPPEVLEHLRRTAEGPLRIDDPVDRPQLTEEGGEGAAVGECGGATGDGQLARGVRLSQASQVLRAKDRREGTDGEEEGRGAADPFRAIRRQGAARDEAMEMPVLGERLAPRVEDRGDPDRAAEMPRIAAEGEQRVGGRAEEQRVDHPRIALRERVEVMRQREDDMKVGDRQQVGLPGRKPPCLRQGLTLRTVPVAAGVVRHANGAAAVTRLLMSAQGGGATRRDRAQGSMLHGHEALLTRIRRAVRPDDVGQLESRPRDPVGRARRGHGGHGLRRRRDRRESGEQIEARGLRGQRRVRQMPVARRRGDRPMAQQALDRVQVHAGFEQVRRKRVPQRVNAARLGDARAPLRQGIRPLKPRRVQRLGPTGGGEEPGGGPRDSPVRAQGV